MGKRVNGLVLMTLHAALEAVDLKQFMLLFKEAVEDTGALEDDCSGLTKQRREQFEKGVAKILKARKGALKDEELFSDECDCEGDTCEVCYLREHGKRLPKKKRKASKREKEDCDCFTHVIHEDKKLKMVDLLQGCQRITRTNVGNKLSQMTGLHIWLLGKKTEIVPFYPAVVERIMRESDTVNELHAALASLFECGLEMSFDETVIDGDTPLLHSKVYPATIKDVITQ